MEGEGERSLGSQQFWSFEGGSVGARSFDMSHAAADGTDGLRGKSVGATIMAHKELVTKECLEAGPGVEPSCRITSEKVVESGIPLHLCRRDHAYPKNSVEGSAIATFAVLEKSLSTFEKEFSSSRRPAPVWMLVLPELKTDYLATRFSGEKVKASRQRVDNAFWGLTTGRTAMGTELKIGLISVLPPSKSFQKENSASATGLWELPFVIAHEYGHHVFYSKIENLETVLESGSGAKELALAKEFNRSSHPIVSEGERGFERRFVEGSFPSTYPSLKRSSASTAGKPTRVVRLFDAMQSINESFADLFGELVFPAASASMKAIPGVCLNREIARESFRFSKQEVAKRLDSFQLEQFLSPEFAASENPDSEGCIAPSYQDSHVIGAIIAHGADAIIKAGEQGLRGRTLELWLNRLNTQWPELVQLSPADFLENSVWSLVRAAAQSSSSGRLNAEQCAAVARVFPAYFRSQSATHVELGCGSATVAN
jgi:hypothetical protein